MMYQRIILWSFWMKMVVLSACSSGDGKGDKGKFVLPKITVKGITVYDARAKEIHINQPAQRVVCLFSPTLDVMYMLGAGKQIVGGPIDAYEDKEYCDYYAILDKRFKDKVMPTPGGEQAANVEAIVALKPDLVILYYTQDKIAEKLEQVGIPVYLCVSLEYEEIMKELRDVAALMGMEVRGEELFKYVQEELDKVKQRSVHQSGKKSVYFTWAYGRIFNTRGRGMMNTCLELANARNACATSLEQVSVDPEMLIKWNPDAIIMWNDSPSLFYNRKEFQGINAIKNKQIYNLEPMFFYNVHNLKALCAVIRIYNVLYGNNGDDMEEIKQILIALYGKENTEKMIALYN